MASVLGYIENWGNTLVGNKVNCVTINTIEGNHVTQKNFNSYNKALKDAKKEMIIPSNGEKIELVWAYNGSYDYNDKDNIVVMVTNKRIIKLDKNNITDLNISNIKNITIEKTNAFHWDKLLCVKDDFTTETFGIFNKEACNFFWDHLNKKITSKNLVSTYEKMASKDEVPMLNEIEYHSDSEVDNESDHESEQDETLSQIERSLSELKSTNAVLSQNDVTTDPIVIGTLQTPTESVQNNIASVQTPIGESHELQTSSDESHVQNQSHSNVNLDEIQSSNNVVNNIIANDECTDIPSDEEIPGVFTTDKSVSTSSLEKSSNHSAELENSSLINNKNVASQVQAQTEQFFEESDDQDMIVVEQEDLQHQNVLP